MGSLGLYVVGLDSFFKWLVERYSRPSGWWKTQHAKLYPPVSTSLHTEHMKWTWKSRFLLIRWRYIHRRLPKNRRRGRSSGSLFCSLVEICKTRHFLIMLFFSITPYHSFSSYFVSQLHFLQFTFGFPLGEIIKTHAWRPAYGVKASLQRAPLIGFPLSKTNQKRSIIGPAGGGREVTADSALLHGVVL